MGLNKKYYTALKNISYCGLGLINKLNGLFYVKFAVFSTYKILLSEKYYTFLTDAQ